MTFGSYFRLLIQDVELKCD